MIPQEEEQKRPGFAGRSCAPGNGGWVCSPRCFWKRGGFLEWGYPKIIHFHSWLVVWNICYFPFHIWDVILRIDFHIFQDGYCTTNQIGLSIINKASIFWGSTILGNQPCPGDIEWDLRRVYDKKGSV